MVRCGQAAHSETGENNNKETSENKRFR